MLLRSLLAPAIVMAGFALAACAATPLGATEGGIQTARQNVASGAAIYDRECASCHGKRGEGLSAAPNIMGPGALPTYARDPSTTQTIAVQPDVQQQQTLRPPGQQTRQPFRSAQDLYEFTSQWMPQPQARIGSLKPEEYWAIVNFMLTAHGSTLPPGGITPQNAKDVAIAAP